MKNNYLALGGLFSCLHILFLIVSKFIVGSELLLVLFLPLLSTIYTIKCDRKNILMFVISTILMCCIFDVVGTFIYVIPSLVSGVLYGALRKKKVKELELLLITSLGHMVCIAFSFLVIVALFKEISFMEIFSAIFSLSGEKLMVITLLVLLVLGFCEAFLVHLISDNELARFTSKVEKTERLPHWFMYCCVVSFVSFIIIYFINVLYSVFPMLMFCVFFIPYIINGIINFKYRVLTMCLIFVFSLVGIFIMNYIDPLNYAFVFVFAFSPLVVNNFTYNNEKDF